MFHAVKHDIVELMELRGVRAARARALSRAGLRSVGDVARCSLERLVEVLAAGRVGGGGRNRRAAK